VFHELAALALDRLRWRDKRLSASMTEWVEERKKWVGLQVLCQNPFTLECFIKRWAVIADVFVSALAGATSVATMRRCRPQ
jgi:hypothetical protein